MGGNVIQLVQPPLTFEGIQQKRYKELPTDNDPFQLIELPKQKSCEQQSPPSVQLQPPENMQTEFHNGIKETEKKRNIDSVQDMVDGFVPGDLTTDANTAANLRNAKEMFQIPTQQHHPRDEKSDFVRRRQG